MIGVLRIVVYEGSPSYWGLLRTHCSEDDSRYRILSLIFLHINIHIYTKYILRRERGNMIDDNVTSEIGVMMVVSLGQTLEESTVLDLLSSESD